MLFFFVFGMMGLLAIVFAWRTYLFAYFYLSSLLFLLDIAFDTHAIREVYYLHKKTTESKNSVVSNAPTCRGTRIRTWDPLLPKQMR